MRYLLDTNMLSDVVNDAHGIVAQRIRQIGAESICTSIIVSAELRFGARKRGSQRLTRRVEGVLERMTVIPVQSPVDIAYAELRTQLEVQGRPISSNDLLIASQAMTYGLTVVTDNVREFSRIDSLPIENWLRE